MPKHTHRVYRGFEGAVGGLLIGGCLLHFALGDSGKSLDSLQFLFGQFELRRRADQRRFGLDQVGAFDRVKRLVLFHLTAELRKGLDNGSLKSRKDLNRLFIGKADVSNCFLINRELIRSHRLDLDRGQLARRQIHRRLSIRRVGIFTG